jgi:putative serine protease PepD
MRTQRVLVGAAITASTMLVLAGCTSGNGNTPAATSTPTGATASTAPAGGPALQQSYVAAVKQVMPSVVQITTGTELGSGIVFDDKGDIVTNDHVVGAATHFQVRLPSSVTPVAATLLGAFPPDDLAVIRLDSPPKSLRPARFGDSGALQVGDITLALGSPLGLTGSVTNGIVSATGRVVSEPQGQTSPGATLPDTIQTSAAINPGNSGGALVDLAGTVIGIPTLAAVDPQIGSSGSAAPGIGFAISSNMVKDIAGQLVAHDGHVINSHRADLGARAVTVTDPNGQPLGAGIISVVPGGPAEAARITAGDVITAVNQVAVHSAADLIRALAQLDPGAQVPVTVGNSKGVDRTVVVSLGQLPGS